MTITGKLQQLIRRGVLIGALAPLLFTPAFGDGAYDLASSACLSVKEYAQRVNPRDLSQLPPKDVKNIKAALAAIPELSRLDEFYIDNDNSDKYTVKADISPRTVIFPHESCPSGCIGYIVSDTDHGFSSIPFYYKYNVQVEPNGIQQDKIANEVFGGLVLLDLDHRNIVVLQRRDKKRQDVPTLIIAPASQIENYYRSQEIYQRCLLASPMRQD